MSTRTCLDMTGRPFQIGQHVAHIGGFTGRVMDVRPSTYDMESPLVFIRWDHRSDRLQYDIEDAARLRIIDIPPGPEIAVVDCTGRLFRAGDIIDCSGWIDASQNPGVTSVFRVDHRRVYTTATTCFDSAAFRHFRILASPRTLIPRRLPLEQNAINVYDHSTRMMETT